MDLEQHMVLPMLVTIPKTCPVSRGVDQTDQSDEFTVHIPSLKLRPKALKIDN